MEEPQQLRHNCPMVKAPKSYQVQVEEAEAAAARTADPQQAERMRALAAAVRAQADVTEASQKDARGQAQKAAATVAVR
jgi:hypothetical protein